MANTKKILITITLISLILIIIGCIKQPVQGSLIEEIKSANVVMWIGAHPDDELYVSGLLTKASLEYGKETYVVSLREMERLKQSNKESMELLKLKDYIKFDANKMCGSYPLLLDGHFEKEECKTILIEEIKKLFIDKKPSMVITFEPTNGFRSNPEHMISSKLTYHALKESGIKADFYYVINRDENLANFLNGPMDPLPYTDTLDLNEYSKNTTKSLWDTKLELMQIYSYSEPEVKLLVEDKEMLNKLLHKEFYRKVE